MAGLAAVTIKVTVWPASLAAPGEIFVAQPGTTTLPASRCTNWLGPTAKVGGWLTAVMLMVNDFGALVSWPPLTVPPLSCAWTVTTAEPATFGASVKVSVPEGLMAGCTANWAGLAAVTINVTVWPASLAGPGEMLVTKFGTVCGPAFSSTVGFGPRLKVGGWFTCRTVMVA